MNSYLHEAGQFTGPPVAAFVWDDLEKLASPPFFHAKS